jgi:hypothetical protein
LFLTAVAAGLSARPHAGNVNQRRCVCVPTTTRRIKMSGAEKKTSLSDCFFPLPLPVLLSVHNTACVRAAAHHREIDTKDVRFI